jgi:Ca2+-binding RTX toxin-like protein
VIGTAAGGVGTTLTVTFNASATAAAIEALIQNLTYADSYNAATSRTLTVRVTDAAGAATPDLAPPGFAQQTGPANPFNGISVGAFTAPTLADLDGDGDLDAVIGDYGTLRYFQNTGSASAPVYVQQTGAANPFNGIDVGRHSAPALADLDGDGDLDAVVGERDGTLRYFQNTGSASAPVYVQQTGAANPFNGLDVGRHSAPALADLDGDGDLDAVVGTNDGMLRYFQNTGSASAPVYAQQAGTANPFNGIDVGSYSAPTLADLDGDGDLDAVVGERDGTLRYFQNTGSAAAPVYVPQTGTANPFNGIDVGTYPTPTLADLNGDGILDAAVGVMHGILGYFIVPPPGIPIVVNVMQNEAPTDVSLSGSATIAENSGVGTVVGDLSAADPDAGETFTFSLIDAGGRFGISGSNLVVTGSLDYEQAASYDVTLRVTDSDNNIYDEVFTVSLTNVAGVTIIGSKFADVIDATHTVAGQSYPSGEEDTVNGGNGNDTLSGLGGNDKLNGGNNDDILLGGDGNDTLNGNAGADAMDGGAGDDRYYVDNPGDTVTDSGGNDEVRTTIDYSLGDGIERLTAYADTGLVLNGNGAGNVISGRGGNDTLNGGAGIDKLTGGDGDDALDGGADNDTLIGGIGDDDMTGGTGDDTFYVDSAGDQVHEAADEGTDRVITSIGFSLAGTEIENLYAATGASGLILTGNHMANKIIGGGDGDTLDGGAGNDRLNGGVGDDDMTGGTGDDTFYVDSTGDQVHESADEGTDRVITSVDFSLVGTEAENIYAATGASGLILTGNDFANKISGGDGNDTLIGGSGKDVMTGGAGGDTFVFQAVSDSPWGGTRDMIKDFTAGADTIDLAAIDANAGLAGDQAFAFIGDGAFTRHAGELQVVAFGDNTMVSADVDGNGRADFQVLLAGYVSLQAIDFML